MNTCQQKTASLTLSEMQVLHLLAQENEQNQIADKLSVSVRTVDKHISSLMLKTGTRNLCGLMVFATVNDLIPKFISDPICQRRPGSFIKTDMAFVEQPN